MFMHINAWNHFPLVSSAFIQGFSPQPLKYCEHLLLDWLIYLYSFILNTFLFNYFIFACVFYILFLRGKKWTWFAATMYIKHENLLG